jgi:hypothetical protein
MAFFGGVGLKPMQNNRRWAVVADRRERPESAAAREAGTAPVGATSIRLRGGEPAGRAKNGLQTSHHTPRNRW